ncbi:MAG: T9SS type A sorting domain-containing protein [Bacteroidota bacterium]
MRALLLGLLFLPLATTAQTATVETIAAPFQATVIAPDGSAIGGVETVYEADDGCTPNPCRYYQHYPAVWVDGQVYRLSLPSAYIPSSRIIAPGAWVTYVSENADLIYGNAKVPGQIFGGIVRWDGVGGAMTFVEGLPQTWRTEMMAASRDGSVLAGVHLEFENDFAWRWEDGTVTELEGYFLDRSTTEILDVDDQGRVFGARYTSSGGTATWTSLVWDTDGRLTVGDAFSSRLAGVSGDGTTLIVNSRPPGTPGLLVRENETITLDSLRLGRTRPPGVSGVANSSVFPPDNVSHDGTTLYGTFWTDEAVHGLPSRADWFWREGVGGAPIRQVLAEEYGLQIPECPVNPSPPRYGSFFGVLSADGRVLTAQCIESFTPEPDETTYVITLPASASWAEATDGFFDDPDRWAPARVPDASTLTRLAASGADYTVTLRGDQTLPSLTVAVAPEETTPTVTLDLDGNTLSLSPPDDALDALVVGDQGNGLLFLQGGHVEASGAVTIGRTGSARGRLFSDVEFQIDGPLVVGDGAANTNEASSTLVIQDGTTTAGVGFDVGFQEPANGTLLVESGATLQVPSASPSTIGFAGIGQVIVTEGFLSHTGPLTLGQLGTAKGTFNLRGGATALTTDSLVVGLGGIGEMEIVGGSGLSTGPAVLGSRRGSVASVRLAGTGSEWDIAGDLLVGIEGAAVLEVVEGASLCVGGLGIPGAQGRLVTDATVRIGFDDCTSASRTGSAQARRVPGLALDGLVVAPGGRIEASAFEVGPNGVLDGAGILSGPVTNGGTLSPGGNEKLGILTLSSPLTLGPSGVVALEIGADGADAVMVTEAMTLGGTLRVSALPDETPMVGQSYAVMTAPSVDGAFVEIEAPDGLDVSVTATGVVVTVSGIVDAEDGPLAPEGISLSAPAPNPASGVVSLQYALVEATAVRLSVVDALGREVRLVVSSGQVAGEHTVPFDSRNLAPGVYAVRLSAGTKVVSRMLTITR